MPLEENKKPEETKKDTDIKPQTSVSPPAASASSEPQANPLEPISPMKSELLPDFDKPEEAKLSIFDKPKEKEEKGNGIAENIVKLSTDTKPKKSILGDVPMLDESIIDRTYLQKRRLSILYGIFATAIILFAASFGFFYSQLSPEFTFLGANIAQKVETSNQEIYRYQTDINESTYLTAQMILNRFAFDGNKYQDFADQISSTFASKEQKKVAQQQIVTLQSTLLTTLSNLQKIFKRPIVAPVFQKKPVDKAVLKKDFENRARKKINSEASRFQKNPEQRDEFNLYKTAAKLVGSKQLRKTIISVDLATLKSSPEQFVKVLNEITENAKNEFSIVNSLKNKRVNWNEVLTNIINSAKQAEEGLIVANDSTYNMTLYESGSTTSILFSNYTIDVETGRISISGNLKTPDEKTFSTLANLIESFSASPKFTEVDYRAFAKSGSPEKGFESNFRIEFYLQKELLKNEDFANKKSN